MSRTDGYGSRPPHLAPTDPDLLSSLENAVPGGVRSRATDRLALAHDASHYLLTPQAVVEPRDAAQVGALFAAVRQLGASLTFRSGGTSLSGQASTGAILADTRKHFRDITPLDSGRLVQVQPGATVRQVNAHLARFGRKLGPDPASEVACTIGGVVANNSSGMACGTEQNTYQTLESAVLVLPSGTVIDTGRYGADERLREAEPELWRGLLALRDRVLSNAESVAMIKRLYTLKNTMGYGLNSFTDFETSVDLLLHLAIGSEGTLAFIAQATFRTVPLLSRASTGLLIFEHLRDATDALPELLTAGFATIELLDATSLRVAQRDPKAIGSLRALQVAQHAALLVEHQSDSDDELAEQVDGSRSLLARLTLTESAVLSEDAVIRAALWHIRKGLYATVAGNRPSGTTALLEDIAVPVGALAGTCEKLIGLFAKHDYEESVIFGHAKDGNLHFMLNESFDSHSHLKRYQAFTDDMVDVVLDSGGTLKAEHGTGRAMAAYVRRQYGDELYDVMRQIKQLCDPRGMLNPGVLLDEDPSLHMFDLKVSPTIESEVDRCVECGYCEPACPSKDLTLTPRQRIVLRRAMVDAQAFGESALLAELEAEYAYDGIDTCAVDGMCQNACPVLINTGDLIRRLRIKDRNKLEQKAWKVGANHWQGVTTLGRLSLTAAKKLPEPIVTAVSELGRKILGPERVPRYEPYLPGGGPPRIPRSTLDAEAVYFPACIGTIFGPVAGSSGVSSAFLSLCDRAGVRISIPQSIGGMCCSTPWKSKGLFEGFADMRARVLAELWEESKHGAIPVVCDAASCTEGIEALIDRDDERFRGLRIVDAVTFVDGRILGRIPVTTPVPSIALHPTCSSTRLGTNEALGRIAAAISNDVVVPDSWGCCAYAGDRGMLHPELTASATAQETAEVNSRPFAAYASTNRTCEIGLTRATAHDYQHLLELFERATR